MTSRNRNLYKVLRLDDHRSGTTWSYSEALKTFKDLGEFGVRCSLLVQEPRQKGWTHLLTTSPTSKLEPDSVEGR